MILTIAIPTYNRPEKVRNTISKLSGQLNSHTKVLILDNHSDTDIQNHLSQHFTADVMTKITVIRNRINIGPDANFARCFENCDTPFIWTLGDDDEIELNAVTLILAEIEKFKDEELIGFNFNSNCCRVKREEHVIIASVDDLVNKLDDFGNILFLSTGVYKTEEYLKYIRYGIWAAYTLASQIVPPIMAVSRGKRFILSKKYIVTNVPEPDHKKGWSPVQLALSLIEILEMPGVFKGRQHEKFGKKMAVHFNCLYPGDAMFIILRSIDNDINKLDAYHIYIFKQLIRKSLMFRERLVSQLLQYRVCLFLMGNKLILKMLFKVFPSLTKRSENFAPYPLFERNY